MTKLLTQPLSFPRNRPSALPALPSLPALYRSKLYCTYSVYLSSNFNSCPERLREEIRLTLGKDDSCESTLAIYMN